MDINNIENEENEEPELNIKDISHIDPDDHEHLTTIIDDDEPEEELHF